MRPISYAIVKVPSPGTPVNVGAVMATVVGSEVGPFTIISTNKQLLLAIDGGADQSITLTTGTRTAAQVVSEINGQTTGLTASATANGKVVVSSNSTGPSSSVLVQAATHDANTVLGFPVGLVVGSDDTRCAKIRLTPLKANAGDVYVGSVVNFDPTTGVGLLDRLMKPLASPSTLDTFNVESHTDSDVLHTEHYFIDADNANDGVIAVIWVE